MVMEVRVIPLNRRQMEFATRMVQNHMRRLLKNIADFAEVSPKPAERIVVYGSANSKAIGNEGLTGTDLFYLMKRGAFQSEMGFPKRYNPERQVAEALSRFMITEAWRSKRTARLMRIFWRLDYDKVVDEVRYRIPSGRNAGREINWLKFLDPNEGVSGYGFRRLVVLRGGTKGAETMGKRGMKRPRAYGRAGVGAVNAGYMIKGHGSWTLSQRANPLNVKKDWYMKGVSGVAAPMFEYWKKKIMMLHRQTLRSYRDSLGGFA